MHSSTHLSQSLYCIAHRGGSSRHTENTLAALNESLLLGVDAVEVDVWKVGSELLVTHDRRLGKTLYGQGLLINQCPEVLRNTPLPCGNKIATLQEVLNLVGNRAEINIELKGPGCAEAVAQCLTAFCCDHQLSYAPYIVSSFDHPQLYEFKQLLPQIRRGVLMESIQLDYARCCEPLGAFSFHPNINFINQALIDDAHKRGLQVWAYTVNELDDLCLMSEMGVDGVFTDEPARLLALNADVT